MKKNRFTEKQITGFIKQAEAGMPIKELCRKGGFSDASFCKWRSRYGVMDVADPEFSPQPLSPEKARGSIEGHPAYARHRGQTEVPASA